jgi:putative ABC transport system ATP-binding protein
VLLADEPTGSLDAASGAGVIDLLFGMNREYGTTLVLVTHDETLAGRCGRSVRLAGGRIVP